MEEPLTVRAACLNKEGAQLNPNSKLLKRDCAAKGCARGDVVASGIAKRKQGA